MQLVNTETSSSRELLKRTMTKHGHGQINDQIHLQSYDLMKMTRLGLRISWLFFYAPSHESLKYEKKYFFFLFISLKDGIFYDFFRGTSYLLDSRRASFLFYFPCFFRETVFLLPDGSAKSSCSALFACHALALLLFYSRTLSLFPLPFEPLNRLQTIGCFHTCRGCSTPPQQP